MNEVTVLLSTGEILEFITNRFLRIRICLFIGASRLDFEVDRRSRFCPQGDAQYGDDDDDFQSVSEKFDEMQKKARSGAEASSSLMDGGEEESGRV